MLGVYLTSRFFWDGRGNQITNRKPITFNEYTDRDLPNKNLTNYVMNSFYSVIDLHTCTHIYTCFYYNYLPVYMKISLKHGYLSLSCHKLIMCLQKLYINITYLTLTILNINKKERNYISLTRVIALYSVLTKMV